MLCSPHTGPWIPSALPRRLLLALAIGLGTALPAQSLGLEVSHYDKQSGVPKAAADQLGICMAATANQRMLVNLWGGRPGALAGIAIGRVKASVPVFGATLLVVPDLLFFSTFDSKGEAAWNFPLLDRLALNVQGIQMDLQKPGELFTLTWGLDFRTLMKQPTSTAFDAPLATVLMDLSHDAYEYPERKGRVHAGMRLAGGFQVLSRIESPNPTNEPWFQKMLWPDTQLFIARNPASDIAVVFRGTDFTKPRDIVTDFLFTPVEGFHPGIALAYASVHAKVGTALTQFVSRNARVLITGHSLGGGLAPMGAYWLAPVLAGLGVPKNDVALYSFAGPRVMSTARCAELAALVPHHFGVANKDDIVTHVPPYLFGLDHIPRMRVLYPRRAMITEHGSQYGSDLLGPLMPGIAAHYQDEYSARLRQILPAPKVWLTVSAGGNMTLNWSFPERKQWGFGRDFVALYRGDPIAQGTNGYLANAWQWASESGSYETNWPKGQGFHAAYIQEYAPLGERKFLATSEEYKSPTEPVISLAKQGQYIAMRWTYPDIGKYDWVAIYQGPPTNPDNYLCGGQSWQWALGRTSYVTNWQEARNVYVAYVAQETANGQGRIIKTAGPYNFVGAPTVHLTYTAVWPYLLQVNYTNARAATYDWVAIYDRDPTASGAIRLYSNSVTGSGWVQSPIPWQAGFYAAHFEKDCLTSDSRLVAKWGPLR